MLPKAPENFFLLKAALLHRLGLDTKSDSVASDWFSEVGREKGKI